VAQQCNLLVEISMTKGAFIENTVTHLWQQPDAGHVDGAYSKMLVTPQNSDTRHFDYRISVYQPKGSVAAHSHRVQEQIYQILEGEGLMELDGEKKVVRRHDVIFIPPGVVHALHNTGFQNLVFIVVTSPPTDQ
jgi:mannose-6-phosphate isomerase-like protein (cupin superfamily)